MLDFTFSEWCWWR